MKYFISKISMVVIAFATWAGAHAAEAGTGVVSGHVSFQGGPAKPGIVVSDTVVYLTGGNLAALQPVSAKEAPAVFDQRDLAFVPHVLPIFVGTTLEIRNSDQTMHNVNAQAKKNPSFNYAMLGSKTMQVTFKTAPEIIPVNCNVHSQMRAFILVLPNPFFSKAGKDGSFSIAGVPTGKYELTAWHEKYGISNRTIEVSNGQTIQADIDLTKVNAKESK